MAASRSTFIRAWFAGLAFIGFVADAHSSIIDPSGTVLPGDFNGDGNVEVVVSSPETNCGKGAIYVISGASITTWTRDTSGILGVAACDDLWGASLAVGDINADGYDDLAIGVPGASDSGESNSGSVHVIYGSSSGLTATGDQIWHQDVTGIEGASEVDDYLGDAVEMGDFNCDGYADIAIGVPREAIGSVAGAGAVNVLYGSSTGVSTVNDIWYQGTGGVNSGSELEDNFGAALAHGNFNGDVVSSRNCDDLAIGSPNEDIGTIDAAGWVYIIDGGSTGLETVGDQTLQQDIAGVVDTCEASDQFGWRVAVADVDDDGYDDLMVAVPGDECDATPGTGRHLFYGDSQGIATAGNTLECDTYGCSVLGATTLGCHARPAPVYGTAADEVLTMFVGDDAVWGWDGADVITGDHGDDRLFGGDGDDVIDGGAGRDAQIGGNGNDTFIIDADCQVLPGEIVDGGPGNDVIHSHRSQSVLQSLGLTIVSVESFVVISEDPLGTDACDDAPVDDGPMLRPRVQVAWANLPSSSSVYTTTTGILTLRLANTSDDSVVVAPELVLRARGRRVALSPSPVTVAAATTSTYSVDLNDFIPSGVNPSQLDPGLFVLPSSASITLRAALTVDSVPAGYTTAPTIFGHLENGNTAVLYRQAALHGTYYDGDLARWRTSGPADSGPGRRVGRIEAQGALGIPGY